MYGSAETFFPISEALLEKGVGSAPWLAAALVTSVFVMAVGGGAVFARTLG